MTSDLNTEQVDIITGTPHNLIKSNAIPAKTSTLINFDKTILNTRLNLQESTFELYIHKVYNVQFLFTLCQRHVVHLFPIVVFLQVVPVIFLHILLPFILSVTSN